MRSSTQTGPRLLAAFLKKNRLTREAAATALGVSKTAVIYWVQGKQTPEHPRRQAIEHWTHGAVPASAWQRDSERQAIDAVQPFDPAKGEACAGGS